MKDDADTSDDDDRFRDSPVLLSSSKGDAVLLAKISEEQERQNLSKFMLETYLKRHGLIFVCSINVGKQKNLIKIFNATLTDRKRNDNHLKPH